MKINLKFSSAYEQDTEIHINSLGSTQVSVLDARSFGELLLRQTHIKSSVPYDIAES